MVGGCIKACCKTAHRILHRLCAKTGDQVTPASATGVITRRRPLGFRAIKRRGRIMFHAHANFLASGVQLHIDHPPGRGQSESLSIKVAISPRRRIPARPVWPQAFRGEAGDVGRWWRSPQHHRSAPPHAHTISGRPSCLIAALRTKPASPSLRRCTGRRKSAGSVLRSRCVPSSERPSPPCSGTPLRRWSCSRSPSPPRRR